MVRTDLCSATAAARQARSANDSVQGRATPTLKPVCLLLKGNNTVARNRATSGAGGGLLVTNVSTAFAQCHGGGAALGLVPVQECWAGADAVGPVGLTARGLPYDNQAKDPGTDNPATIATRLVVTCAATGRRDGPRECRGSAVGGPWPAAVVAPLGSSLRVAVQLQDWRGSMVLSGADLNMGLQARVYRRLPNGTWRWRPDLLVIGNTTNANGGMAQFWGLQVAAPPGGYQLRFSPLSPQHVPLASAALDLRLRGCVAGEANLTAQQQQSARDSAAALAPCQECRPGTVSLDPLASGGCARCGDSLHANCTGYALMPDDGYWHSHPRSPLVHRCLLAAACQARARQGEMQAWAQRHAADSVAQLQPVYREYSGMQ